MHRLLIFILIFGITGNAFAWQSPDITDIRFGTHPDYTRIVFELTKKIPYRISRDARGNIVVDFPEGKVASDKTAVIKVNDNVIDDIRIEKLARGTRANLNLGKLAGSFKTNFLNEPWRLVIDITRSEIIRTGVQKKEHKIEIVVIDPGHGGKDPGAIGRNGMKEKIVVLDIARYLEKFLGRERDLKVVMTRRRDEFISLDERVKIANANKGGLFVSIHTNSSHQRSAGGFETFYLGESKTDAAKSVVILENSVLDLEERPFLSDMGRTLDKILWDLRYSEFKIESKEFAGVINLNMDKRLALRNRGIKGALLYVLRGVAMPAALVETAFISNYNEEAMLRRSGFRQLAARAICDGILQYRDQFESTGGFTE